MEGIKSGEVFPNAKLTQGERPKQTEEGHEHCVYYVSPGDYISCPHGGKIDGGVYSEYFLDELKMEIYRAIDFIDELWKKVKVGDRAVHLNVYLSRQRMEEVQKAVEHLRELSR